MKLFQKNIEIWLVVLLALVSRLPYLLSPDLMLDGDESIVGLMSKHFIEGKDVPLFFYGQTYGFSFLEVLFISGGYLIGGVSDLVIKASMLLLWTIGVVFFYKTALIVCDKNKPAAFVLVLLMILAPAWIMWSMKARGGYITAFTLSNIVLYLSLSNYKAWLKWTIVGLLSVVIFYAQPLWLPGLLPFVIYGLMKDGLKQQLLVFVGGTIVMLLFFQLLLPDTKSMWQPTVLSIPNASSLAILAKSVYSNFGGHYYLLEAFEQPLMIVVYVWVFLLCAILFIIYAVISLLKGSRDRLHITGAASLLCCILYMVFTDLSAIRYVLPVVGYVILFIGVVWRERLLNPLVFIPLFILLVAGALSLNKYDTEIHNQQHKVELLSCIDALKSRGITHVYCNGPLEQWQLMFYSKEDVIARYFYPVDRYQPYIDAVDSVYKVAPERTALLGLGYGDIENGAVQLNSSYYIIPQPDKQLLKDRSFDIP